MIRYSQYQSRILLAAPTDPSGGGDSQGNPAAAQGGVAPAASEGSADVDPFAGLDLDDLDPAARAVIEKGKEKLASLQKKAAEAEAGRVNEEKLKRQFQSSYDQLQVQVQKLTGKGAVPEEDTIRAQHLERFTKILVGRNVPEPQAKVQAEIMLEMMTDFGTSLKGEIGRDLAPFAGSVVQREAEAAWHQAVATDKVGALQIPAVAEQAWKQVEILVNQGQQVTPAIVKNLCGMAYLHHLEAGGTAAAAAPTATTTNMPPQLPNFGRASYPGSGAVPFQPPVFDPKAPKHVLDPATDAALQSVMGKWDVKPKAYRGKH